MQYRLDKEGYEGKTFNRRELRKLYLENQIVAFDKVVVMGKDGDTESITYLQLYSQEQGMNRASYFEHSREKHFEGLDMRLKIMLGVAIAVSGMMIFSTGPFSIVVAIIGVLTAISSLAFYQFFQQAIRVADKILERHEAEERRNHSIDIDV